MDNPFKQFEVLDETIKSLSDVFEFGDVKHPGNPWKVVGAIEHLGHAFIHGEDWDQGVNEDHESHLSNLAHMAVRAIMALDAEIRGKI